MDKKDQSQNENRTYFRLELSEPVKVYGECDSFEEVFGDISKTGLMFLSGKKFKIDEEITFGLNHPTEGNFKINGIVKRIKPKKIDLEKANSARHFFCFTCEYKAYKKDHLKGVKWISINSGDKEHPYDYIQRDLKNVGKVCPACKEETFYPWDDQHFEIGCQFFKLDSILNRKIEELIENSLQSQGLGQRKANRLKVGFLPTNITRDFSSPSRLFDTYLKDISKGGLSFLSEENLNLGELVKVDIGVMGSEKFKLDCKILEKKKEKNSFFNYHAKIEFFDYNLQTQLSHFIHELSRESFLDYKHKKFKKNRIINMGTFGFSGFAIGFVTAAFIFGISLFLDLKMIQKSFYSDLISDQQEETVNSNKLE